MNNRLFFLFSSIALLFISCEPEDSANVNQDSIYVIYKLAYDKNDDITIASTKFSFGGITGTPLELNDPASATFNSDDLLYHSLLLRHEKEYSGRIANGTFVYADLDNNTFTNTVGSVDSVDFPVVDTINAGSSFNFQWVGEPVKDGETVSLDIDGTQQDNFEYFSISSVGATELILSSAELQNLGQGEATCTLTRTFSSENINEGTSEGGRIVAKYSVTKTIYINQ